jgi:outer membrane lipoprotein
MSIVGIQKVTRSALVSFLVAACLNGCATVPSRSLREEATAVAFKALQKNTHEFKGKRVILGGYIIETLNEPERTLLVILQAPLDFQNRPQSQDLSEGRFLIETKDFLDPLVFSKDRRITVGGTVQGTVPRQLGNTTYPYPMIESIELHLWANEPLYPRAYDSDYLYPYRRWHPYDPYPYPWW